MRGVVVYLHVARHTDLLLDVGLQYAGVFCGCPWPPRLRVLPPETAHPRHGLDGRRVRRHASRVSTRLVPAVLCELLGRAQVGHGSTSARYGGTPDAEYNRRTLGCGVSRGHSGNSRARRVLVGEDLRRSDITASAGRPVRRHPTMPVVETRTAHGTIPPPVICSHL